MFFVGGCVLTALMCLTIFAARRRILTNVFNQRLAALLIVAMVANIIHRLLGIVRGSPIADTIMTDTLFEMTMFAAAAATMLRRLAYGVLPLAAGLVMTVRWPHYAASIYIASSGAAFIVAALVLTRVRHDPTG